MKEDDLLKENVNLLQALKSVLREYEVYLPDPERVQISDDVRRRLAYIDDMRRKYIYGPELP